MTREEAIPPKECEDCKYCVPYWEHIDGTKDYQCSNTSCQYKELWKEDK